MLIPPGFDPSQKCQGARSVWAWCIPSPTTAMATAGIGSADLSWRWSTSESASVWGESHERSCKYMKVTFKKCWGLGKTTAQVCMSGITNNVTSLVHSVHSSLSLTIPIICLKPFSRHQNTSKRSTKTPENH